MVRYFAMLKTVRTLVHHGPIRVELARWNGKLVVVKRLSGFSPKLEGRLAREAEVAAKLRHPNIVPLLAVKDSVLIYDYCPGVNLGEMLARGSISPKRSIQVIAGVLAALTFAHERNVIHFDVKPANIMVRGCRTRLTDFGFAKDLALATITAEHMMMGTPGYMAPEQFQGQRNDPRSDVFAAGAVLYHMLQGEPPYGKDILPFLLGYPAPLLAPLSRHARFLQEIVDCALQYRPENRFGSAAEMSLALRNVGLAVAA